MIYIYCLSLTNLVLLLFNADFQCNQGPLLPFLILPFSYHNWKHLDKEPYLQIMVTLMYLLTAALPCQTLETPLFRSPSLHPLRKLYY